MRKFILTISLLGGLVPSAWCVPQVLNFQGRLLESGALVNGSRAMTFKIFDVAGGGSQLFTESRSVNVSTGVFNVLVGDATTGGIPLSVFDGSDRYIEVQVGTQILPRQRVVSVGYSFKSQSAAFAAESSTAAFAQRAAVADSISGAGVAVTTLTATTIEVTTITVTNIVATSGTISGFLKIGKNTIILGETPLTGGLPNTIAFTGGNATIKTQAPSEGSLTFESGGTQHIVFNPGGNIGIGTASPGAKLDVAAGGIASGQANTTTGGLTLYNGASSNATVLQAGNATAAVTYKLPLSDGLSGQVLSTNGNGQLSWITVGTPPVVSPDPFLATTYIFLRKWGSSGTGPGQFSSPAGVDVDGLGNIYVADAGNQRIQKFASDGTFLLQWGDASSFIPRDVAVDNQNNIYVTVSQGDRVFKFTSTGALVTRFGVPGLGASELVSAVGIALDDQNNVYIVDSYLNMVKKYTPSGSFIMAFGSTGSGDGQFGGGNTGQRGIAVDRFGNIFVADGDTNRIQKFDPNGNFIAKWGTTGTDPGQFRSLFGLTVDPSGNVYAADAFNSRIQKFTSNGTFMAVIGGPFTFPTRMTVDGSGNVIISDTQAHQIQIFTPQ